MKTTHMLKSVAAAALLIGASLSAQAAVSSTTTNLGTLAVGSATTFSGGAIVGNSFLDTFNFTLPDNGGTSFTATNYAPGYLSSYVSALITEISLYSTSSATALTSVTNSGINQLTLTYSPSLAGNYYLKVAGVTGGLLGGGYNGAISVAAVTPVPEPETYAMLLAGLGVMGFIARRRKV
jgi:hypothetical protein